MLIDYDELKGTLCGCDTTWILFLGRDPLDESKEGMYNLIKDLHKAGKKVCIFTRKPDPFIYNTNADHYHITIDPNKHEFYRPILPEHISYGFYTDGVNMGAFEEEIKHLKNKRIYIYPDKMDDNVALSYKRILQTDGFRYVYYDQIIEV